MKRSFLKLLASALLFASPLATLAAGASAGTILLITSDSSNAAISGQPGLNHALNKEVDTFTTTLRSLLESSGHATIVKDSTNSAPASSGRVLAGALAGIAQKVTHVGTVYWGPDASNNIMITVDFYAVNHTDAKGSAKLGDKNHGKRMLFLAAGNSIPANPPAKLATEFNEHLARNVFNK